MSNKKTGVRHGMQGVFVFVLLGIFAVMSTLMVLLGAQMYRNTVDHATANNEDRVLGAYVRSMIRAEDGADDVAVEEFDGTKVLALNESIEGENYVTWLYCYEGQLYEQYTSAGHDFEPQSGSAICPAQSCEPKISDGLLTVDMTDGAGQPCTVCVGLRCAR